VFGWFVLTVPSEVVPLNVRSRPGLMFLVHGVPAERVLAQGSYI
jgi:hypothetical protein